jgi:SAM-dependent methyltransferase
VPRTSATWGAGAGSSATRSSTGITPRAGLEWLDVGCGNGAFTELVYERCAPPRSTASIPRRSSSPFARTRPSARIARFALAGAESLPFPDDRFDVAVMPLVLHFVPDPARGVAEMARVVRPGGIVAAYVWDMEDGGFPYAILLGELRAMGIDVPSAPSPNVSRPRDARPTVVRRSLGRRSKTRAITVERTFADFDDYWTSVLGGPSVAARLAAMTAGGSGATQGAAAGTACPAMQEGRSRTQARANAVEACVPKPR